MNENNNTNYNTLNSNASENKDIEIQEFKNIQDKISKQYLIDDNFFDNIKKTNILPFETTNKAFYTDDLWKLPIPSDISIDSANFRFDFKNTPNEFKNDFKDYIISNILDGVIKTNTIKKNFTPLNKFFSYLYDNNCFFIEDIDEVIVNNYLTYRKNQVSIATFAKEKYIIKDFLIFYSIVKKKVLNKDILNLLCLTREENKLIKAYQESAKVSNIEDDYFNKFLSTLLYVIKEDSDAPNYIKGTACFFIILSQTGLRISEAFVLEANALKKKSIDGYEAHYMYYKTWKGVKGDGNYTENLIYINELTKFAYEKLEDIYREKRKKLNTKFLYLGYDAVNKNTKLPIHHSTFKSFKLKLFAYIDRYFNTINLNPNEYSYLSCVKPDDAKNILKTLSGKDEYIKTITYPKNHQFRVHMCTELYNKGIPLKYIQKFMAHLTTDMTTYYIRRKKEKPQEDMDFSRAILSKIATKELKILGEDKGLTEKIDAFIKENNFNVEKDLDTIVDKLAYSIPIRQKTGGVCIKSSIGRECSKDYKTNEFFCAYNVCPNIFHFYYMANVSYKQCLDLLESININKINGHIKQTQKEIHMLNKIAAKFLKELDELKNMIQKRGKNAIIEEYSDLEQIITNFDKIYKEAEEWKIMKA